VFLLLIRVKLITINKISAMKRLSLLAFLLCLFWESGIAQTIYAFTAATTANNAFPLASATNRRQCLYLASDFPTAPSGNITKIYIKAPNTTTGNFTTFEIKMGATMLTGLPAGPFITTGMTTVFTAAPHTTTPATISAATGDWIAFTLSTPFYYDNTQNFIVDMQQTGYSPGYSLPMNTGVAADRSLYGSATAATASNQARVYQLAIEIAPANCTGTPDVPTITGPSAPVCGGTSVSLTSSGHSTGTTYAYQWQSRPAGSTGAFTDEASGTTPNFNPSPMQSTEYQLVTKCTSSGMTSTSNKVTVNITPGPSISSISETHSGLAYSFSGVGVQNATSQTWDYGDGNTGSTGNHTYAAGGTYTVTLTATGTCGTTSRQLTITASPNVPCTTPAKPTILAPETAVCHNAAFELAAVGYTVNTNISFQWQRAIAGSGTFTDIPGATGVQLTTAETDDADYRLVSTCASTGNITMSDVATVSIIQPPKIDAPADVTVQQYENAIFITAGTQSNLPVNYRWQSSINGTPWVYISDNGNYQGVNTRQLIVLNATIAQDGMMFRCVLEENGGCNFVPDISAVAVLRVNRTASVNDMGKDINFSVYPNPVSGSQLFINAEGLNTIKLEVSIIDMMGRILQKDVLDLRNNAGAVNISNIPAGIYNIRLADTDSNTTRTLRFTKE
jgi:PKD repeat protein